MGSFVVLYLNQCVVADVVDLLGLFIDISSLDLTRSSLISLDH